MLVDVTGCEYSVEWGTPLTCEEEPPTPIEGCQVTDLETGFLYDLSKLTVEEDYYQVRQMGLVTGVVTWERIGCC